MIGRRELLQGFGASVALAALAPLASCRTQVGRIGIGGSVGSDPLRTALRTAVARLSERFEQPTGYLLERRRVRAMVDNGQSEAADEYLIVVVLSARDGTRQIERCIDNVSPERIEAIATALLASEPRSPRPMMTISSPIDRPTTIDLDPSDLTAHGWLDRARSIAARGDRISSSRLIYRAAYLTTDDDRAWIVGESGDYAERFVRTRIGASFVAWHRSEPLVGEAEVAGAFGPVPDRLDDAALAAAADDALALFTPTAPTSGMRAVLLEPRVVAVFLDRALPIILSGGGAAPASAVTLVDDPTIGGYGGYTHDDRGNPGAPTRLIEGGRVIGRLGAGNARRCGPRWRLVTAPSNLRLLAGSISLDELGSGIDDGLIITGLRDIHIDNAGTVAIRARGREVIRGRRTGRAWGDIELRTGVHSLLADIAGVATESKPIAIADDGPPRSVTTPWLLTSATVGSARGNR